MSRLSQAFDSLTAAKTRATGKEEFIFLDGRKVPALVTEITADEINIMGGVANSGGFRCQVKCELLAEPPEQDSTEIKVRGQKLYVVGVTDINGVVYEISAGDPSTD